MTVEKPTAIDAMNAVLRFSRDDTRTVVPCTVISYSPETMEAAIQPAPQERTSAGEPKSLTPIPAAPVVFPGSGGWSIDWPLLPNAQVLALVSDRGIDRWRQTGTPYLPDDGRRHRITDCFVQPIVGPFPTPIGTTGTGLMIRGPSGVAFHLGPDGTLSLGGVLALQISPTGHVLLGQGTMQPAARDGDLVLPGTNMAAWITAVSGVTGAVAPTDFGTVQASSTTVEVGD